MIELVAVARIGSPDDSIYYVLSRTIVGQLRQPTLYLVGPRSVAAKGEATLDIYDRSGARVKSLLPVGQGPQELATQFFAVARGDTVVVFGSGTLVVLSPDGAVVRKKTTDLGFVRSAFVTADGRLLTSGTGLGENRARPYHEVSLLTGGVTRSFGPLLERRGSEYDKDRRIAPGRDNRFWSVQPNRYAVELWTVDGALVRRFERDATWFEPWLDQYSPERGPGQYQPFLFGVYEDASGRLFTASLVPKDRSVQDPTTGRSSERSNLDPLSAHYDTVLEVLDVEAGRVIASLTVRGATLGFFGKGLLTRVFESKGVPYLEILSPVLRLR